MGCGGAKWKREEVHDHKFDFINVNDFYETSLLRKLKYSVIFLLVIKSTLVFVADIWTVAVLLIYTNDWRATGFRPPFNEARYIYLFCIFSSIALLLWDGLKARAIVRSRDIGLAYTSPFAYRIYVLQSYAHYCFFSQINNSKKATDDVAFFVFFTLKGWKRLLFAEAPRQIIAGLTIYGLLNVRKQSPQQQGEIQFDTAPVFDIKNIVTIYQGDHIKFLSLLAMMFTFTVFVFSALFTLAAIMMYIPLLYRIRGNLKEYCCHKIDKRIGEMLRKKTRKRVAKEAKLRMIHALQDAKTPQSGSSRGHQPTLPDVEYAYEYEQSEHYASSEVGYARSESNYHSRAGSDGGYYGYAASEVGYYPPAGSEVGYHPHTQDYGYPPHQGFEISYPHSAYGGRGRK